MTQPRESSRIITQGRSLGRSTPRVFTQTAWWRFAADRRRRYVSRIPGKPNDAQAALVQSLIRLEWSALRAESEGTLMGDREGREHRRLFQRLLDDFERGLAKSVAAEKPMDAAEYVRLKYGSGSAKGELDAYYARMLAREQDAAE
jgi:hypothetical protein